MATVQAPSPSDPPHLGNSRRSSSLSDIGDTAGTDDLESPDHGNDDDSELNDTEAETERLEDSPFKRPRYQNVVMSSGKLEDSRPELDSSPNPQHGHQHNLSESSSLHESSDQDDEQPLSTTWSPRKRKRSSLGNMAGAFSGLAHPQVVGHGIASRSSSSKSSPVNAGSNEDDEIPELDPHDSDQSGLEEASIRKSSPVLTSRKSPRKSDQQVPIPKSLLVDQASKDEDDSNEAMGSHDEDIDAEDVDNGELDNTSKSQEELVRKKSALDSLTALEKCFATLRDKLFDERLAAANEELTILQTPGIVHPELLLMKESVDRHREQKINYQRTFFRLKLETLRKESIATRHQVQSQYMQTVRDVRDQYLDRLNQEFYQIQRERRNADGESSDPLYLYSNVKTQNIIQQTAYNNEVSLLSGIAKHVGFPAAPSVAKANQAEVEEDFRSMGVVMHSPETHRNTTLAFNNDLKGPNKQAHTAEERFIESNAWANPQHPVHQRQIMQRQPSHPSNHQTTSVFRSESEELLAMNLQGPSSPAPVRPAPSNPIHSRQPHNSRLSRYVSSNFQRNGVGSDRANGTSLLQGSQSDSLGPQQQRLLNGSPTSNGQAMSGDSTRSDGAFDHGSRPRAHLYSHNHESPPPPPSRPALVDEVAGQAAVGQSPVNRHLGNPTPVIAASN